MQLFEDIFEEEWDSLQPYIYFMRYVIYASAFVGVIWLVSDKSEDGEKGKPSKSVREMLEEYFYNNTADK
jgi:hypothetical protein